MLLTGNRSACCLNVVTYLARSSMVVFSGMLSFRVMSGAVYPECDKLCSKRSFLLMSLLLHPAGCLAAVYFSASLFRSGLGQQQQ